MGGNTKKRKKGSSTDTSENSDQPEAPLSEVFVQSDKVLNGDDQGVNHGNQGDNAGVTTNNDPRRKST